MRRGGRGRQDLLGAEVSKLRVLILWPEPSGYMLACAQALAAADVHVRVVTGPTSALARYAVATDMGFEHCWLDADLRLPEEMISGDWDLLLVAGWHIASFRQAAVALRGKALRVLHFDNQWSGSPKQLLGVATRSVFLRPAFDAAFVPGARQKAFAHRLGFAADRIAEGSYCCDIKRFAAVPLLSPEQMNRRRRFLFVGRLVPEKNLLLLAQAYRLYRANAGDDAWDLHLRGDGPLAEALHPLAGVTVEPFTQPSDLAAVMSTAGALVLPSTYEPWGVVLHEGAAAGLPLLASHRVGSSDSFLRHGENGLLIREVNDPGVWAAALAHLVQQSLFQMSSKSRERALTLTPSIWVRRLLGLLDTVNL